MLKTGCYWWEEIHVNLSRGLLFLAEQMFLSLLAKSIRTRLTGSSRSDYNTFNFHKDFKAASAPLRQKY